MIKMTKLVKTHIMHIHVYDLNQTGEAPEYIYPLHVLTFLKDYITDYLII